MSNTSNPDKPKFINAKRRGFLQGAAVAGGAVASGAAISSEIIPDAVEEMTTEPTQSGYQKTEHVKRYYARARF